MKEYKNKSPNRQRVRLGGQPISKRYTSEINKLMLIPITNLEHSN